MIKPPIPSALLVLHFDRLSSGMASRNSNIFYTLILLFSLIFCNRILSCWRWCSNEAQTSRIFPMSIKTMLFG